MTSYRLDIKTDGSEKTFDKITDIIGWTPRMDDESNHGDTRFLDWSYIVDEIKDGPYYDFVGNFLDKLEDKFADLNYVGVTKEDISIWLLYEYDQQCGLEFNPKQMKRLGDAGITLCIDCWQKSETGTTA